MPVLAIGGEKSHGPLLGAIIREVTTDVTEQVIPNAGHWPMREQPTATIAAIRSLLDHA
jgi:pimeloyl-ACP methyl ester carboxylesterase